MSDQTARIRKVFAENGGILRMVPNFIPRPFGTAGRRMRLHPDDYFAFGMERGAIKERWFSSVVEAQNGPLTTKNEGMSYVSCSDDPEDKILFADFIRELGADLIGGDVYAKYGTWPMFAKFFDYNEALFFHMHLKSEDAAKVGRNAKPEAYFFPAQYNPHEGTMPATYFGFKPGVTKEDVKKRLERFDTADNHITDLSVAYRMTLGTGWYTAPGVLHAPASLLTYEPQWNSDVNAVFENFTGGQVYGRHSLVENVPEDKQNDLDYIVNMADWEANLDPAYEKHYFRPPIVNHASDAYIEKQIVYETEGHFSAKELTILPGQSATVADDGAFGCVVIEGHGTMNGTAVESPNMLRYGQLSDDEFFVAADVAARGITYVNHSKTSPLVMLKHFAK